MIFNFPNNICDCFLILSFLSLFFCIIRRSGGTMDNNNIQQTDQPGAKSGDQLTESSSEKDDLSLASWMKHSSGASSKSKSEEIIANSVRRHCIESNFEDVIGDAYQWDSYFLTGETHMEWHCPEPTSAASSFWCQRIKFANNALENYLKFLLLIQQNRHHPSTKVAHSSEDANILSKLALKPSFLDSEDRNIMNVKAILLSAYQQHHNTNDINKLQNFSMLIENFENSENCEKVNKLAKVFESLTIKLRQKRIERHFNKLTNADTINKVKKLRTALATIKRQMAVDGGYCAGCNIPDPDQIKLDFGAKIVKNLKTLTKKLAKNVIANRRLMIKTN